MSVRSSLPKWIGAVALASLGLAVACTTVRSENSNSGAGGTSGSGGSQGGSGGQAAGGSSGSSAGGSAGGSSGITEAQVVKHLAEKVVLPAYQNFAQSAEALVKAADADRQQKTPESLQAVKDAWKAASASWQIAEVMQVGPAAAKTATNQGKDLRDGIYSWPLTNPCRVDQEIVEGNFANAETFRAESPNVRGLDAIEYLAHNLGTKNDCPFQNVINQNGSWQGLSESDLRQRRADYTYTLAVNLAYRAGELIDHWNGQSGSFLTELTTAGSGNATFADAHTALNAISDAMFYVEKETKDLKMGKPLGKIECGTGTCPDAWESRFAKASREHVIANLKGYLALFAGGENDDAAALGFDDLLVQAGAGELAKNIKAAIQKAIATLEALPAEGIEATLANDPSAVENSYNDVAEAVRPLKVDVVKILNLNLPQRAQGDND